MTPPQGWWRHPTHVRKVNDYKRWLAGEENRIREQREARGARREARMLWVLIVAAGAVAASVLLLAVHVIFLR